MRRPSEVSRGRRAARRRGDVLLRTAVAALRLALRRIALGSVRLRSIGLRSLGLRSVALRGVRLRSRLLAAILEVGRVPPAALQLEAGGGEHLGKRLLAARRAHRHGSIAPLLEKLLLVAAARAAVLVEGHSVFPRNSAKSHFNTSTCSIVLRTIRRRFQSRSRRRLANQPPAASTTAMLQKTGDMPSAAPTPPNASGSTVWLALSTTERTPTASPARPSGAVA